MKFCTIFAVFIIVWTIVFNIAAEPIFFKHPGGILFPIKGSADKQQRDHTKHSKHRERRKHQSHRRHVTCITCMSVVAEPITINPTPVTAISEPIIVAPPAVTEPNIIIPAAVKEPIIISPPAATEPIIVVPPVVTATSPTLTTASTATTMLFGPGNYPLKCQK